MFGALRRLARPAARLAAAGAASLGAAQLAGCDAAPPSKPKNKNRTGGVADEYTKERRSLQTLEPPLENFFSKELVVLGLPIRAHACVSDAALAVAADRLSRMLRHLPDGVRDRLARRGAAFHVVGIEQGCSDLPEHRHMKGVAGGYTNDADGLTLDQRARGMGGVRSSCGEENLVDLDSDPRYAGRDILTHEFAHCVMDYGLPEAARQAIVDTWRRSVEEKGRWTRADGGRAYAGSCASEYFAEATMWYFGTHGEFVDREKRLPTPGPGGLAEHDPDGFALLASIYGGTHPSLGDADPAAERLAPLGGLADGGAPPSSDDEEKESELVALEVDNGGCDCTWKVYWVDADGARKPYGEVAKGTTLVQQTFPGHTWELVSEDCGDVRLAYRAVRTRCRAALAADKDEGERRPPPE